MNKWKVLSPKKTINSEDDVIDALLKLRNIGNKEKDKFLSPSIDDLKLSESGISIKDLEKAKKRLNRSIQDNEKIIIIGDYDVDGICGSAILWETIYSKYKNIFPYIPDRFSEGYGISLKTLTNVFEKYSDVKLILTVDNGIVANEAVDFANEKGIDVIITDHHVAGEKLPKAHSIIHTTSMCGAGVAWMFARELGFLDKDTLNKKLELASLATIADLVPLVNLNRTIAVLGFKYLKKTERLGLLELYKNAGIDKEKIGSYEIGHIIGPRINATGRVYHAVDSLRLICSNDKEFVVKMARKIEETNKKRQQMVAESVKHAKLSVLSGSELKRVVVVNSETYSEGVVGLISSRLMEEYYRPSFAISKGEEYSKGSARSIHGINIIELLRSVSHLLEEVGGHPMAAGFSLKNENIEKLEAALIEKTELSDENLFSRIVNIDMEISVNLIKKSLIKKIEMLSPFGIGNYEPLFLTKGFEIINIRLMGKDSSHLKLTLSREGKVFDAIGFGMGEGFEYSTGDKLDLVYKLDLNVWNGVEKIQLKIKDLSLS